MAKRKRLTPAKSEYLTAPGALETKAFGLMSGPPIAQVSGDVAAVAALEELSEEFQRVRDEGRLIQSLPLASIVADHLVRDRMEVEQSAFEELLQSLRARGQQTPVEVVDLGQGRYGLISGWRRLTALQQLARKDATEGSILAVVRQPAASSDAYVAMVEENEIRVGLSFFERARIVRQAVNAGVYDSDKLALQGLFPTALPAKRSKIKSFLLVVDALEGALRFPTRIPEHMGLALAKALASDPELSTRLSDDLHRKAPATASAEAALLAAALKGGSSAKSEVGGSKTKDLAPGINLSGRQGRVVLSGAEVNPGFIERLRDWVRTQS
ncbi:MAG: ParB N-terminal domain-containing protein [Rhodobacteraceae bacterium]|nr:ParB N-terminal domain-containing protein [Paracoccaceae bacterium]